MGPHRVRNSESSNTRLHHYTSASASNAKPSTPSATPSARAMTLTTTRAPQPSSADVAVSVAVRALWAPSAGHARGSPEHFSTSPDPDVIAAILRGVLQQARRRSSLHRHKPASGTLHTGTRARQTSRPTTARCYARVGSNPTTPNPSIADRSRIANPEAPMDLRHDGKHSADFPRTPHRHGQPQWSRRSLPQTNQGSELPKWSPNRNRPDLLYGLQLTVPPGIWRHSRPRPCW